MGDPGMLHVLLHTEANFGMQFAPDRSKTKELREAGTIGFLNSYIQPSSHVSENVFVCTQNTRVVLAKMGYPWCERNVRLSTKCGMSTATEQMCEEC